MAYIPTSGTFTNVLLFLPAGSRDRGQNWQGQPIHFLQLRSSLHRTQTSIVFDLDDMVIVVVTMTMAMTTMTSTTTPHTLKTFNF